MKKIAVTKDLVFQRQSNSHRPHVSPYESSFNLGVLRFDDKTKQAWRTNFHFPTIIWRRDLSSASLRIYRSWGSQSLLTQDVTTLINCTSELTCLDDIHISIHRTSLYIAILYISFVGSGSHKCFGLVHTGQTRLTSQVWYFGTWRIASHVPVSMSGSRYNPRYSQRRYEQRFMAVQILHPLSRIWQ